MRHIIQQSSLSLSTLAWLVAMSMPFSTFASEEYTEFDTEALKARGLDPKLADLFREAPRFLSGENTISLRVNGRSRGKVKAKFDQDGKLCADQVLLKQAGLIAPARFKADIECFDLKTAWPQTEINLDPSEARVDIVVPQDAVGNDELEGNWKHGGFAGLFNYNAQYMKSSGSDAGVDFMQLGSEAGFNLGNWIVRSRQNFSSMNGVNQIQHQAAYAQRTFTPIKKVLQAGQISLSNSMFGTGQVLGFQMFPETALQNNQNSPALVEGIADTQSVVEVRQSGVLVYSTTVPAGRFRLQGFPLLNTRSDLVVAVTSSNGEKREFIVPASALLKSGHTVVPGLTFGMGKLDQQGSSEAPFVATIANGWQLTPRTSLNAGLLGSSPWQAGAVSLDTQFWGATQFSVQTTLAQDKKHESRGLSTNIVLSRSLSERVGVSFNATQQSEGYRELSDALQDDERENSGYIRNQFGGGVSWAAEKLGSFSLSWAQSNTFDNDSVSYLRAGWSRQIAGAYVSASIDHNTGGKNTDADNRLYLTMSLPLGRSRNVSSYLTNSSRGSRAGARFIDRTSQDRSWSISGDHDFENKRSSTSATMNMVTPLSQLSGSVSSNTDNYTTWAAQASGAVVAHNHGLTLSPYRVGDTFGIAQVRGEGGVRLDTPAGPTWTDRKGYAVIPSLSSYKRSAIQVDTRSLAKNVDISNAWQETEAARGSVNYVEFDVVRTRRVLADVKDSNNAPLPHGASVFDEAGNFVTVVGKNGSVFIPDVSSVGKMDVQVSGKTMCSFSLSMPSKANDSELYENANAVCE